MSTQRFRRTVLTVLVLVALCSCLSTLARKADALVGCPQQPCASLAGQIVVRFATNEVSLPPSTATATIESVTFQTAALEDSVKACDVGSFQLIAPEWTSLPTGQGFADFSQVFLLTVPDTVNIDSLTVRMATFDNVRSASPNHEGEYFAIDDPDYPEQWHLENTQQHDSLLDVDIDAESAWDITMGSSNVIVHVVDTGIELHQDILVDAAASKVCTPSTNRIHGTAVAGIISAQPNGVNVRGVAPLTRVANNEVGGSLSPTALGCSLSDAANKGARIANMSWGFQCPNEFVVSAIRNLYLSGAHGCFIVAGAGNTAPAWPWYCPAYPAALNHLAFAVSAVLRNGRPYPGGLYNNDATRYIDVAAPGGADIVTTRADPANATWFEFGGTSAAAPVVSGIAALLVAENDSLSNDDLGHIIERTATDLAPAGPDSLSGAGLVNAHRALKFISSPRVVQRGSIPRGSVSVSSTSLLYEKTFVNLGYALGDMSIPDAATTYLVERIDLEGFLTLGTPYLTDIRHVWVRHKDGLAPGWPDEDPMDCMRVVGTGYPDPAAWDSTSATLRAYTFAVYDVQDTSFVRYAPIHPDSVDIPYTAVLGSYDEVPFVEVHSPNGGEHWLGGNRSINWAAFDDDGIDSVSIFLSLDDGMLWTETLATGVTADTSWIWTLAGSGSGSTTSRIGIVAHDAAGDWNYDMSDAHFQAVVGQTGGPLGALRALRAEAVPEPDSWTSGDVIYMYVPAPQKVDVSVFDVRGRRVRTIVDQVLAQGLHRVAWDETDARGQGVASGVYFYRFQAGHVRRTGKLTVMR